MTEYAKLPPVTFEVRPIEEYRMKSMSGGEEIIYEDKDGNCVLLCFPAETISYCPFEEKERMYINGIANFPITRKINKKNPVEKEMLEELKSYYYSINNCLLL